MASDINVVMLVGRLTRDSELKYTSSQNAVCRFSLAVNRRRKNGDKWEDEVSYIDVVVWGKQGENINQYLEKGRQVAVTGELRQNRWEADGQSRSRIEVVANNVQLVGGTGGTGRQSDSARTAEGTDSAPAAPKADFMPGPEQFDDDIPF